jgi:isobutyryl-CoA mutase
MTCVAAYDGHDAAVLAVNRALGNTGRPVEVVYIGFNKRVKEIAKAAAEEGADIVAISSYNGGHRHFLPAVKAELERLGSKARIVAGGGATVSADDADFVTKSGAVDIVYGPGVALEAVAHDVIDRALQHNESYAKPELDAIAIQEDFKLISSSSSPGDSSGDLKRAALGRILSAVERNVITPNPAVRKELDDVINSDRAAGGKLVFVMGDGGAGKSTLTNLIADNFVGKFPGKKIAVLSVDPSSESLTSMLGDRIRMNALDKDAIFMRSIATRNEYELLPSSLDDSIKACRAAGYDVVLVETPATGQIGLDFGQYGPDASLYVKTKEFGTVAVQTEKDQLLRKCDLVVLNKIDREGSHSVFEQLKHFMRVHKKEPNVDGQLFATQAKVRNDVGCSQVFSALMQKLGFGDVGVNEGDPFEKQSTLVPHPRRNYLHQIATAVRKYDAYCAEMVDRCERGEKLDGYAQELLDTFDERWEQLSKGQSSSETFTGLTLPRVAMPPRNRPAERLRFALEEGLPGTFPYASGVFPLRREGGQETTRQFAGLRLAEHTNERFHFLSRGVDNPRLSTAFDGITLYGDDSDSDPGSLGKIGEGGVAVDSLDDMKILYGGFDFRKISTSLTINGPAPAILAMFFNTACDSLIEDYKVANPTEVDTAAYPNEYGLPDAKVNELREEAYTTIRGTVQADILKEVQAQNECIFQTDFAIKLLGDIEQFFVDHKVKKFYSLSISGYHIGEAGATPIQEMAFTISNGFSYLENFMGRGMPVDEIADNFSFFFRHSQEAEWMALGPVMRKIWAIALRDVYEASPKAQMFKYHTQTSGRALQVEEWDSLNPIRQTLHSIVALLGNTNSLHVDSADEPLTTPSEKFVRQAVMIPNYLTMEAEFMKIQNLLSGSYAMRELCATVQEEVLKELERIDDEGGVGPATEVNYQRSQIAQASSNYEHAIYDGQRPIIGRNVMQKEGSAGDVGAELVRPQPEDWDKQLARTQAFRQRNSDVSAAHLANLRRVAEEGGNVFEELLTTVRYCTLGEISATLSDVGGRFTQQI